MRGGQGRGAAGEEDSAAERGARRSPWRVGVVADLWDTQALEIAPVDASSADPGYAVGLGFTTATSASLFLATSHLELAPRSGQ